jgi:hypothetical protein
MQNLILSLPKEQSQSLGIYLPALESMLEGVTDETRIVFSVYETDDTYDIKSKYPYSIAAYALAMTCMQTLKDIFEEEERFDAIVRKN